MNVKLANHQPNAIEEIYKAYRLCYSKGTQEEIKLPYEDELRRWRIEHNSSGSAQSAKELVELTEKQRQAMIDFIKPLMAAGHTSPLEHVSFTFYINGVSRALTHQLVRHRTGKYNQQSQRYVKLDQFEYVVPPAIEKCEEAKKRFLESMKKAQADYDFIVSALMAESLGSDEYKKLPVFNWTDEDKKTYSKIQKKAIEDARYVFPNACTSNITMTIDAHNFRNFIAQRTCVGAQWEIKDLANEMLKQAEEILPFIGYKAKWCGTKCKQCGGK